LQGLTVVAAVGGTYYLGSGSPADPSTSSGDISKIATVPGRPATVFQAQKAEERREEERAALKERFRQAELQSERDEQKRAEEALLRPTGQSPRNRPIIGQDGRNRHANI
jgi:IS5 family transposase